MIRAGSLNEIISIKTPVSVPNGSGGSTTTYEEVLNTFSEIKELSVSNDMIASQDNILEVFQFKIRYRQDIIVNIGDVIDFRGRRCSLSGFKGGFLNRAYIYIIGKTENESTDNGA